MDASDCSESSLENKAADKAMKKIFLKLIRAVTRGEIVVNLYSEGLIDEETFDKAISQTQTSKHKGAMIVREVQSSIKLKPSSFSVFIKILRDEDVTKEVAQSLEGML